MVFYFPYTTGADAFSGYIPEGYRIWPYRKQILSVPSRFLVGRYSHLFYLLRDKIIKVIPITLAIILMLSSFGPWGAFSWAVRNQVGRLAVLSKGHVSSLGFKDKKGLSSILTYLEKHNDLMKAQPYFTANIDSLQKVKPANIEQALLSEYNITYISEWETDSTAERSYYSFSTNVNYYTELEGYRKK